MTVYSERYNAALTLAARAHQSQVRKGSDTPYIVHPVHVSTILLRHGFSEDIAIAGLLHDVVEDQDVSLADIEADFGSDVAEMVATLTEQKRKGDVERPWEVRKREALDQIRWARPEAAAIKAADVIHNAHSLAADLRRDGALTWDRFKRGPAETLGYYRQAAEIVRVRWVGHPLVDELEGAIQDLEQAISETEAD